MFKNVGGVSGQHRRQKVRHGRNGDTIDGQSFLFRLGQTPGIDAQAETGKVLRVLSQPAVKRTVFGAEDFYFAGIGFPRGLEFITPVHKENRLVAENKQAAVRAGEPGQQAEQVFVIADILVKKHIIAGNQIAVEFGGFQFFLQVSEFHAFFSNRAARQLSSL